MSSILVLVDDEVAGQRYVEQRAALTGEPTRYFKVVTPSTWTEGLRADEVVLLTTDSSMRVAVQRMMAGMARVIVAHPRRGQM